MKRLLIIVALLTLVAPAQAGVNGTPQWALFRAVQPYQFSLGDVAWNWREVCKRQGYAIQDLGSMSYESLLETFQHNGVYLAAAHTDGTGFGFMVWSHTPEGDSLRWVQCDEYTAQGYPVFALDSNDGYAIAISADAINTKFNSDSCIVIAAGCKSYSYRDYWHGANGVVSYNGTVTNFTLMADAAIVANRMDGMTFSGLSGRSLKAACAGTPGVNGITGKLSGSNTNIVLTPAVAAMTPTSVAGTGTFNVYFDARIDNTGNANEAVQGGQFVDQFGILSTGDCATSDCSWISDNGVTGTVKTCTNGKAALFVSWPAIKSANCSSIYLDGNQDGLGDNYAMDDHVLEITCSGATNNGNCTNTVASFEGSNAWLEKDGQVHMSTVVSNRRGSTGFRCYGGRHRERIIGEISEDGSASPWYLEFTTGPGERFFEIVELTPEGVGSSSGPFALGPPPSDLTERRSINARASTWSSPPLSSPFQPPAGVESPMRIEYPVTDWILYVPSDHPEFANILQPARDIALQHGWTSQIVYGPADPNIAREYIRPIYNNLLDITYPRTPHAIGVGEANQGSDPAKNLIGSPYFVDSTNFCNVAICAADMWITDFDGDGVADLPFTRIPVNNAAELQKYVSSWCWHMTHPHPNKVYAMIDDVGNGIVCDTQTEPTATLLPILAQLSSRGNTVIVDKSSDVPDACWTLEYDTLQNLALSRINQRVGNIVVGAQWSTRNIVGFLRKYNIRQPFDISMVPTPQTAILEAPGCDMGDTDRNNPSPAWYPTILKQLMIGDHTTNTSVVAAIGNTRAGRFDQHRSYYQEYFAPRNSGEAKTYQEAEWLAHRRIALNRHRPEYAATMGAYGLPVPITFTGTVAVDDPPTVGTSDALQIRGSNPFRGRTTLSYTLSGFTRPTLKVYNIAGQVVRTLINGEPQVAGQHDAIWDGRNDTGSQLPSGTYFIRLAAGSQAAVKKMVILK